MRSEIEAILAEYHDRRITPTIKHEIARRLHKKFPDMLWEVSGSLQEYNRVVVLGREIQD